MSPIASPSKPLGCAFLIGSTSGMNRSSLGSSCSKDPASGQVRQDLSMSWFGLDPYHSLLS